MLNLNDINWEINRGNNLDVIFYQDVPLSQNFPNYFEVTHDAPSTILYFGHDRLEYVVLSPLEALGAISTYYQDKLNGNRLFFHGVMSHEDGWFVVVTTTNLKFKVMPDLILTPEFPIMPNRRFRFSGKISGPKIERKHGTFLMNEVAGIQHYLDVTRDICQMRNTAINLTSESFSFCLLLHQKHIHDLEHYLGIMNRKMNRTTPYDLQTRFTIQLDSYE